MSGKIDLEIFDKSFRPRQLDNLFRLGLVGGKLDPPLGSPKNQCAIEGQTREVAQAQGTGREQRDNQAVAKIESARTGSPPSFGSRHQSEAEIEQFPDRDQSVPFWPGWLVPRPNLRV